MKDCSVLLVCVFAVFQAAAYIIVPWYLLKEARRKQGCGCPDSGDVFPKQEPYDPWDHI